MKNFRFTGAHGKYSACERLKTKEQAKIRLWSQKFKRFCHSVYFYRKFAIRMYTAKLNY